MKSHRSFARMIDWPAFASVKNRECVSSANSQARFCAVAVIRQIPIRSLQPSRFHVASDAMLANALWHCPHDKNSLSLNVAWLLSGHVDGACAPVIITTHTVNSPAMGLVAGRP